MLKRQKNQVTVVLSVQERKRLADVFILLIAIDKRVQSQKTRAKRAKKTKEYQSGSLNSGPLFFIRLHVPDFANLSFIALAK